MKFIIDCPVERFDRCKAVVYDEIRSRSRKDLSHVFRKSLRKNVGGDRFFIDHQENELSVNWITYEQEQTIRKVHEEMGSPFK